MGQPFIGEIRMFGGTFAPSGWMFCSGQTVAISEYETLFNLIGTTYGGDGQETFSLPDLRGRVPVHIGTGGGGTIQLGELGGAETVTLLSNQIGAHSHPLIASGGSGDVAAATATSQLATLGPGTLSSTTLYYPYDGSNQVSLHPASIGYSGVSTPHDNIQPSVAISFIISLYGIYPSPA